LSHQLTFASDIDNGTSQQYRITAVPGNTTGYCLGLLYIEMRIRWNLHRFKLKLNVICKRSDSLGIHDASTPHDNHRDLDIAFPKFKMSRNTKDTVLKEGRMETKDALYAEHIAKERIKAEILR
jgi:hypothetical protein